ncbi:hypothetical protein HYR99_16235 [Candidatus Poribacteria bacterium]|nr:hypothetical protein [Candidatus Poribacteria bacterium]
MAVVKGVKEKVHLPLYDSITVKSKEQLSKTQTSNVMRFFQDVTGKTKLQTNMQAASLLPHWNTFEARAMRVVISDLTAQFPEKPTANLNTVRVFDGQQKVSRTDQALKNLTLGNFVELRRRVEALSVRALLLSLDDINALSTANNNVTAPGLKASEFAELDRGKIETLGDALATAGAAMPPNEQIFPNNGFGSLIGKFIYNSVTTFFVGEKIMIQVPTWFFPAGAGPYSEDGRVTTHGEPSPEATFRFAEPIFIDTQQNFRVEIEIPEGDVLSEIQKLYGPFFIWVVLDGYMTRDVQ